MKRESKDSGIDSKVRKFLPRGVPESRGLVEPTIPAIFILQGMRLVFLNPATEKLAGYSQIELLGMKFTDLFPEDEKKSIHKFFKQAQKSESQSTRGEFSLLAKDGQERLIDLTLSSFDLEGKKATLGTAFVITKVIENARPEIKNARPDDDVAKRIKELELLYQVSCNETQSHSLSTAAQQIIDSMERVLKWNGSIWLVEDQIPVLLAHCSMGLTGETFANEFSRVDDLITSLDVGIIGWVCKTGTLFISGDIRSSSQYIASNSNIRSELCVPLSSKGKTIGCINVESVHSNAFSEQDKRLLVTISNQVVSAIENSHYFEETHQLASSQSALYSIITKTANAGTNPAEILDATLDQTMNALMLDMGAIWLSWSSRDAQRVASRNIPQSIIYSMISLTAQSAGGSQGDAISVDDWRIVDRKISAPFLAMGVITTIIVPIFANDKRIGGLAIASSNSHRWTLDEIALMESIGHIVGSAAERAILIEETTIRLDELEAVNKVLTSLRLTQSLQEMLPQVMDETLKILDAEAGGIWLFSAEREKLCQVIGRGWCVQTASIELDRGESLPGNVFANGDIYFSRDVEQDPLTSPAMRKLVPRGYSAICLPIHREQEPIGVLIISSPAPREFTSEDARLLVTITEFAGIAIHRTRLNEQMALHTAELEIHVAERTAELQSALLKAQAADQLKSEFVINVNHELRTPLTNLILYYQMLRAQPTVKTLERLDVIGRELQRLRNLIEELLNLSRFDLGQIALHPNQCDLNNIVLTLINDRRPLAEERGLELNINLKSDLVQVWLDEATIVQAISNLLTNAMNYTPRGGKITVETLTRGVNQDARVGFRIQDTGLGIDSHDLPHLFERFYRGKAGHESGAPGTGLGLAIVKQIVEHHKGKIEVENTPGGRGAVFTIWLPVKQETD
jgi:PAS domain S-box-containing protein